MLVRYLRNFHELGILRTARARNAIDECGKMKGFSRLITQVCPKSSFYV